MKKIISICFLFFVAFYASEGYSHNSGWVASSAVVTPTPPVVEVPSVPAVTYSTFTTPINITYGWVPYYYNSQIVTEKRFFFCRRYFTVQRPAVQWVYQPVYIH